MHFRHRQTDGVASWHKREMYILHLALKMHHVGPWSGSDLHFCSPQQDTSLRCETTDTGLVQRSMRLLCPSFHLKLYCLVTDAHKCEQLAQGYYLRARQSGHKTLMTTASLSYPMHSDTQTCCTQITSTAKYMHEAI